MAAEVVIHANHIMQPVRKRGFRSQAVIHSQHLHAAFVRELYRNGIVGIAVSGYITSTVQVKNDRGVCMNARGRDPMRLYPLHNSPFQPLYDGRLCFENWSLAPFIHVPPMFLSRKMILRVSNILKEALRSKSNDQTFCRVNNERVELCKMIGEGCVQM